MAGEERIVDRLDGGVCFKKLGNGQGVRTVAIHPHRKRLEPAHGKPAIKRAGHRAGGILQVLEERAKLRIVAGDGTSYDIRVTAHVLGGAVEHQVGTERKGPLQIWGGKRVVDDQQRISFVRDVGHRRNVRDPEIGVGRRFHPDHLRLRRHCRPAGFEIAEIGEVGLHTVARECFHQQAIGAGVDVVGKQDFIAGIQQPGQVLGGGGPRSVTERPGRRLKRSDLILECGACRITGPPVLESLE